MDSLEILQKDYEAQNSDDAQIKALEAELGIAEPSQGSVPGLDQKQTEDLIQSQSSNLVPGQAPQGKPSFAEDFDPALADLGESLAAFAAGVEDPKPKDGVAPMGGTQGPSQKEFTAGLPAMLRPFFGENTLGEFNTQALASLSDAVQETGNSFIDLADVADNFLKAKGWTQQEFIAKDTKLEWTDKSFPAPIDLGDKAARALAKYVIPMGVLSKTMKAGTAAMKTTKGIAGFAAFGFLTSDPEEERLSNYIADHGPDMVAPMARLLATEADDSRALSRFKSAAEGIVLDVATAGTLGAVAKGYRGARAMRKVATGAAKEADVVVAKTAKVAKTAEAPKAPEEVIQLVAGDANAKFPFKVNVERLTNVEDLGTFIKSFTAKNIDSIQSFIAKTPGREDIKQRALKIFDAPEEISKLQKLTADAAVTPEQKLVVDTMYTQTADEFLTFIKKYNPLKATDADKARYIELEGAMTNLQKISHATSSNWGKTGQAMQIVKEMPASLKTRYMDNLVKLGGKDANDKLAVWKKVANMEEGDFAERAGKVIQKSFGMKMTDALVEFQRNSLLSSARTLMTNTLSPVITTGQAFIETGLAAGWSKTGLLKKPLAGEAASVTGAEVKEFARAYTQEPVSVMFGSIADHIIQAGKEIQEQGMVNAYRNNKEAAKEWFAKMGKGVPERSEFGSMLDATQSRQPAITAKAFGITGESQFQKNLASFVDAAGAVARTPTYALAKTDQVSGQIIYNIRKRALATREIINQGLDLNTKEGKDALGRLLLDVDDALVNKANVNEAAKNIHEGALQASKQDRFVEELDGWMGTVNDFVNGKFFPESAYALVAVTKTIAPFARVSLNMATYGFERIPGMAMISGKVRAEMAAGGARQAMAMAKQTTGAMYMSLGAVLASQGVITGNGPRNPDARKLRESSGWMAKSVKIGDTYYDLNKFGAPLSNFLTFAADIADVSSSAYEHGIKEIDNITSAAAYAFTDFITPSLLTRDMAGFLELLNPENQGKAVQTLFNKFAASLVPTVVSDIKKQVDPYKHETWVDKNHFWPGLQEAMNKMAEKTPYFSSKLPVRRDLFGNPVEYPSGFGPDVISPIAQMTNKKDKVTDELIRLGVAGTVYHPEAEEGEQHLVVRMPPKSVKWGLGGQTMMVDLSPEEYDKYVQLSAGIGLKGANKTLHQALGDEIKNNYPSLGSQKNIQNKRIIINKIISKYREAAKNQLVTSERSITEKFNDAKQDIVNVRSVLEEPGDAP